MKEFTKKMARMLLGDYCAYQIYAWSSDSGSLSKPGTISTFRVKPVDEFGINSSTELLIREQVGYAGPGSRAYACFDKDRIIGVCFYWFGNRYLKRNFWPLQNDEAKLVQIISVPEMRGRGVASMLIAESCGDMNKEPRPKGRSIGIPETMGRGTPQAAGNLPAMIQKGFSQTYARIWH